MAVTAIAAEPAGSTHNDPDDVIDLRGHRLAELVQALTGCDVEHAEIAVSRHPPGECVAEDEALDTVARALVELR